MKYGKKKDKKDYFFVSYDTRKKKKIEINIYTAFLCNPACTGSKYVCTIMFIF